MRGINLIILIVVTCLVYTLVFFIAFKAEDTESYRYGFDKPGICPVCGEELVKGVYGQYAPNFVWYCPKCP